MYKVCFDDDTFCNGGTINNSKWNDIPSKQITKLEYFLDDRVIILKGFKAYNHIVEYAHAIFGAKFRKITQVVIMGQYNDKVAMVTIDFMNKKITKAIKDFGKEFKNKPTTGWKAGITSSNIPNVDIKKLKN